MAEGKTSPFPSHKALACEFIGTFLLVFTVGCNVLSGNAIWGGVSIACVLMVSIYAMGGISGANFNPAVSFALFLSKTFGGNGIDLQTMGAYWVMQMVGACCAKTGYRALYGDYFVLGAGEGYGWLNAALAECLYTFVLCFVVLNVAVAQKNETAQNQFYGLSIGFVIVAGAYGAGGVSGGCFNPAVAFGITSLSHWTWLYGVFELLGAALATVVFTMVRPEDYYHARREQLLEKRPLITKLLSEFIGTFVLVLTVGYNVLNRSPAAAFSIAASLMSMIYALGDVSGAHFNPAVTFSIFVCGGIKSSELARYWVAQFLGGALASFTYACTFQGRTFDVGPKNGSTWVQVMIAEVIFTFLLCYVVLGVAVSPKTKSKEMYGLAIGSCVTVGGFAIGGISGGSLNPAVSFGIATTSFTFKNAAIYSVFELIGAGLAAGLHKVTHEPEPEQKEV